MMVNILVVFLLKITVYSGVFMSRAAVATMLFISVISSSTAGVSEADGSSVTWVVVVEAMLLLILLLSVAAASEETMFFLQWKRWRRR